MRSEYHAITYTYCVHIDTGTSASPGYDLSTSRTRTSGVRVFNLLYFMH